MLEAQYVPSSLVGCFVAVHSVVVDVVEGQTGKLSSEVRGIANLKSIVNRFGGSEHRRALSVPRQLPPPLSIATLRLHSVGRMLHFSKRYQKGESTHNVDLGANRQ
jgi:hypothetical protein